MASPPVAEILWATREILLEILKVSETTVWAQFETTVRAAAERTGILWRTITEEPSVLKGSKRKLRLDQRIYGFSGGEEVRDVAVPETDKLPLAKISLYLLPTPLLHYLFSYELKIIFQVELTAIVRYITWSTDWENETFICP